MVVWEEWARMPVVRGHLLALDVDLLEWDKDAAEERWEEELLEGSLAWDPNKEAHR